MYREDAKKLIGQKVEVWTACNGTYVGVLEDIIPSRPWRGSVKITGVLSAAHQEDHPRQGFRPGDTISVGGVNIKPTNKEGTTYLEALERYLAVSRSWAAQENRKDIWCPLKVIPILEKQIEEERMRQ